MAHDLKAYKIFIATPGGLEEERKIFRDVILAYNESDANHRNVHLIPVGWEITLGGVGRPQAIINEEITKCDYFVLLLWDRWGSPPNANGKGKYTSGTEEEHGIAWECFKDVSKPMRQIVAFFKAVDPRQLSDPGEQLKKVLDFRRTLERDKILMFDTFDAGLAFKEKLRCYLAQWVRDHEQGSTAKPIHIPDELEIVSTIIASPNEIIVTESSSKIERLINEAWELADQGRLTDAETKFAQAMVHGDAEAMNNYGLFLDQIGRQQQAEIAFVRARELSLLSKDQEEEAVACENLGSLFLRKGEFSKAEQMYRAGIAIHVQLGNRKGEAAGFSNLAGYFKIAGDNYQAEEMYVKALDIYSQIGFKEGMAISYNNLGVLFSSQDDFAQIKSQQNYNKALEIYLKTNNQEGVANVYSNLGLLLNSQEKTKAAKKLWKQASEIFLKIGQVQKVEAIQKWFDDLG